MAFLYRGVQPYVALGLVQHLLRSLGSPVGRPRSGPYPGPMAIRRRTDRPSSDAIARALAGEGHLKLEVNPDGPHLTATGQEVPTPAPERREAADEASPPSDAPPGSGDPEIAANRERLQALRQQHYGVSDLGDLLRSPKWMFWTAVLVAVIVAGIVIRSSL